MLQFKYSKNELENFKPYFRYLSFDKAKDLVSTHTGEKDKAEKFLIYTINNNALTVWHPLVGVLTSEQSFNGERWQHCYFEVWKLNEILQNELGISREERLSDNITEQVGKNGSTHNQTGTKIKIFDKRLNVLKEWLNELGYTLEDTPIKLDKQYTLGKVFCDLTIKNTSLFGCIEFSTFDNHFWGKQKIVELTRGNKSAIL